MTNTDERPARLRGIKEDDRQRRLSRVGNLLIALLILAILLIAATVPAFSEWLSHL